MGANGSSFYAAMDKGGLIDAGSHDLITFEEMGVPNWVIEEGLWSSKLSLSLLSVQLTLLHLTQKVKVDG